MAPMGHRKTSMPARIGDLSVASGPTLGYTNGPLCRNFEGRSLRAWIAQIGGRFGQE
jgi:hypothetical protein